jgi:hypothetical protein
MVPRKIGDGVTHLLYENQNRLPAKVSNNMKRKKVMGIIDEMKIDVYAFNEHKSNTLHPENCRAGFDMLFNRGKTLTRAIGGNNKHLVANSLDRRMEGGTGMIAYGELASLLCQELSGVDSTGIARWTYMTFVGLEGHVITILVRNQPCKTTPKHPLSSYQLQRLYFTTIEKDTSFPRNRFKSDLIMLLITWRQEGQCLIVCLDANDHVYRGRIGWVLMNPTTLDTKETVLSSTSWELTATYFRGSKPIDAIWATRDVNVLNACAMPTGYSIGDHRSFVLDFSTHSLVNQDPQPIKRPMAW